MKCGRPRPLWVAACRGCFSFAPSVARTRRKGRAPLERGEVPGLRRRDGGRLRGVGAPFRATSSAAVGRWPRGVFLSPRRPPVLWGASGKGAEDRPCSAGARGGAGVVSSRRWTASGRGCGASGGFIGRGVSRCAGLASAGGASTFTVSREWAKRRAFRFPRSARAAIAAPRPRRRRPAHGHGRGAPHRPRGCSTALPGC